MVLCIGSETKTVLITHQCSSVCWPVHGTKAFSLSPGDARSVGVSHNLAGDLSWSKRYSIAYNVMVSNKREKGFEGQSSFVREQDGHQSTCGRWWMIVFASIMFISLFFHFPFTYWIFFFLSWLLSSLLLLFFYYSLAPLGAWGESEQQAVWCLTTHWD